MSTTVHDDLVAVVSHIGDVRESLLFVDFDGLLAPAIAAPHTEVDRARQLVASVARITDVVVLSSRNIEEVASQLAGMPVVIVGGHGTEILHPDGSRTSLDGPQSHRFGGRGNESRKPFDVESHTDHRPTIVHPGIAIEWLAPHYPGKHLVVVGGGGTDPEVFRAVTDRGGFAVLVSPEAAPTLARYRLDGPHRVIEMLERLVESSPRGEGRDDPRFHPIKGYGMIGDSRTAALVSPEASIDWMCVPRFDSPSLFAAILDPLRGGRWRIRPTQDLAVQRTYLGETNVLVTRFIREGNPVLVVTDLLVFSRVNAFDVAHTGHLVLRKVEAFADIDVEIEFQPRFDYARANTRLEYRDGLLRASAGSEQVVLRAHGVTFDIADHADGNGDVATALLRLGAGDHRWLTLMTHGSQRGPHAHLSEQEMLDLTIRTWGRWASMIDYDGPWRDQVVRSALVLKGLVYEPTGALVAAPTASLPERIGGERNWDYRYAWIRDSAYVLECFLRIGHTREAETFIRWLSELTDHIGGAHALQPLYRVTGEADLAEYDLDHLEGYCGSQPVRIGNGAAHQLQLDIFGAAMELMFLTEQVGGEVPAARWSVVLELVDTVIERWQDPDAGMWEIRSAPRHHTFSKFQCWLAIDRAIRTGRDLGLAAPYELWQRAADDIRDAVLANCFDKDLNAFTQAYDTKSLDASVLLMPLKGFLPPGDARVTGTIKAIRENLEVADGLLLRYRSEDGLSGDEGAFLLCSFWLIELLARRGELDEAIRLFQRMTLLTGPLGLYAEEIDPHTQRHLGNFPQGFTHMGLIAAATAIDEELRHRQTRRGGGGTRE